MTDITTLNTAGWIHTAFEHLGIGLGAGNGLFTILSTHSGPTTVEGRAGNDTLNVRTIDGATTVAGDGLVASFEIGPHTITTGSGDDTINVGTRAGIGGRNFRGVLDELDAVLTVNALGQLDVDRLDVDDSSDTSANTDGVLTGTTIKVAGPQRARRLDACGHAPDQRGPRRRPRDRGVVRRRREEVRPRAQDPGQQDAVCVCVAAGVKAAPLALRVAHVTDVVVNRARNIFTIDFLGDEALDPKNVAMTGDVSKLEDDGTGDLAAVAVQSWAPSRGETVNVPATSGTFTVSLGSGLAT